MLSRSSTLLALAALAGSAAAQSSTTFAVVAERFLPVSSDPIYDGVMLVRDGRIEAIGKRREVTIPDNMEVVDLGNAVVTPGYVDLHHHVGGGGGDLNDMVQPTNPELRAFDVVRPSTPLIRETLEGGVTTTLFIPGSGTNLSGFGALLKMSGKQENSVMRELGAMKVAQGFNPERTGGDLGNSRMGMHQLLTETLERGRDYTNAWAEHEAGRAPKPKLDPSLEQLRLVFEGKIPVIVHTAGARDCIATARMFQDVFGLWAILSHGTFNGHWAAADLARRKMPVNLGPRTYDFTRDGRFQGIAAGYWDEGCRDISINTDAPVIPGEHLSVQAAMAVRLGLPYQIALKGVTLQPAIQAGIADRVGSLEPGKDADFQVTAGDPLDPRFPPTRVYIEGELIFPAGDSR